MRLLKEGLALVMATTSLAASASANASREQMPKPLNVEEWLGPDNYPPAAIRRGEQGRVVVSISLDATGKPVRCENEIESGFTVLDRETCEIVMAKGQFEPARDKRGRGVASRYIMPVRWKLPQDDGLFPSGPIEVMQEATVSADNRITACIARADGKAQPIGADDCDGPARVLADIRQALKLEGEYRLRAEHFVRHGDTPPPLPPLVEGGRLVTATEERQLVDAEGVPSACTVRVTGEQATTTRDRLGANVCDRGRRFVPPTGKDGKPASQHVLAYVRFTVLPPAN